MRDKLPTIPEDLSEYARIHTGPNSWSADDFEKVGEPELPTPQAPFVKLVEYMAMADVTRFAR
jgi:hypothetical protein